MAVNVKRVEELRDHLKRLVTIGRQDKFSMSDWLFDLENDDSLTFLAESSNPSCGTAGCLAGHMVIMDREMLSAPFEYMVEQLNLDGNEANYMAMGRWAVIDPIIPSSLTEITIKEAIDYLDYVATTGQVYKPGH